MDAITEMAIMLKDRENPSIQGICIGKVLSPPPSIKISANGFILDKSNLVVAKHLLFEYETSSQSVGDHGSHIHTISDALKKGDDVIVIPDTSDSMYFVVGKVGEL